MLEPFELDPREEAVYLALVDAGSLTAAELASTAGEDVPARLESLGLIARLPGDQYCAIEPGIGFAAMVALREERVRRAEEQVRRARAAVQQLAERFRLRGVRHPLDLIDVVVGPQEVRRRAYQLERAARTQLRGIDMPPYLMTENEAEAEMLSKGVRNRWLYDREVLDLPGKVEYLAAMRESGEESRVITGAPFKLLIADDDQAMIALTDYSSGTASALVVGPSILLDGLSRMFEGMWRYAVALRPSDPEPGADLPSESESWLLTMLASGATDKTIARRMGIGLRTVQKRVQQLMERLEVDTRFQAGVSAKARGWL
ncbi:LuxR C-terminal-related transcriptional regulator [Lentzea sp. NPDC051213]|uniref:helix-turn-helix transcriptional regulator n=1 Tax=Lentzea sp. NPDC051213 TaxID=3364126 RepID=UPI0037A02ACF